MRPSAQIHVQGGKTAIGIGKIDSQLAVARDVAGDGDLAAGLLDAPDGQSRRADERCLAQLQDGHRRIGRRARTALAGSDEHRAIGEAGPERSLHLVAGRFIDLHRQIDRHRHFVDVPADRTHSHGAEHGTEDCRIAADLHVEGVIASVRGAELCRQPAGTGNREQQVGCAGRRRRAPYGQAGVPGRVLIRDQLDRQDRGIADGAADIGADDWYESRPHNHPGLE